MAEEIRHINSLAELSNAQIRLVLKRTKVKARGIVTAPPLDIAAINARTEVLPVDCQQRNDIYALMHEVGKLQYEMKQIQKEN